MILFYPCPNHNGQNIANRDCPICGEPQQKDVRKCWPLVSRWTMEEPMQRPGQLDFESQAQIEMEVAV